jgi:hypothetical protein
LGQQRWTIGRTTCASRTGMCRESAKNGSGRTRG